MIDQIRLGIPVFLAALTFGCSDGSNLDEGPECSANNSCPPTTTTDEQTPTNDPVQEPALPDALYGNWSTECESLGKGAAFVATEWAFSSTEIKLSTYTYDPADTLCENPRETQTITYEATYRAELESTSLGEAIKTDMLASGYVMQNDSGILHDSQSDGLPADVGDQYNIFLVNDGKLYGGLLSSGDSTTPETRPTLIDETYGLSRQ